MSNVNPKPLPGIFIDKEAVNTRVKNYLQVKHPLLSQALGSDDSKSAWYSLQQFEELMREMYYLNANGLRIYFGAYDNQDLNYPGMLTVIFVPTRLNTATGCSADIVIDDQENFGDRCNASQSYGMANLVKNLDTLGLCPPGCDDGEFSYPY